MSEVCGFDHSVVFLASNDSLTHSLLLQEASSVLPCHFGIFDVRFTIVLSP